MIKKPPFRKLRGYAFDPSLSMKMDTALINEITYKVPWEESPNDLQPGPIGEYLEVVDYDPTVEKIYAPVNLDDKYVLAQDGLSPSASNPQFHQQMVYAVAMTTIKNFEAGLGRPVLWSPHVVEVDNSAGAKKATKKTKNKEAESTRTLDNKFVRRLRIYPHALRDANAFYSPQKKALLFGYFAARPADITLQMPDNLTFTCLSHDIIAHETTHAILDGLHRRYTEDTNPDVLAFHEAFADIVALFQHFTFPEVLKNHIAATRGDLAAQNLLGKLAQEFGIAIGSYGALRDAIGTFDKKTKKWTPVEPTGDEYRTVMEPHDRGSILVSAVFEAFLNIYKDRVADLLRIASNGTGILQQGQLNPDLVNRLADEAAKASRQVLNICIRALDYCPPIDITFGDYLRAIITADMDLVPDDKRNYRLAFIDAFRRRGIYPAGIKHLSVESLSYAIPETTQLQGLFDILVSFLKGYSNAIIYANSREEIFNINKDYIAGKYSDDKKIYGLHRRIMNKFDGSQEFENLTGLMFSNGWENISIRTSTAYGEEGPSFFIQSLHVASRVGPDGKQSNQVIMSLVQRSQTCVEKDDDGNLSVNHKAAKKEYDFYGGCTLIFDLHTQKLKYAISKPLIDIDAHAKNIYKLNESRCLATYKYQHGHTVPVTRYQAYFGLGKRNSANEPFNFLHNH
ncbi:MAG: hypothetical protein K2X48_19690 [Chitinophagaceae bacterium]|nr:hypothetical protein [Chitinophagaceae bacterium]